MSEFQAKMGEFLKKSNIESKGYDISDTISEWGIAAKAILVDDGYEQRLDLRDDLKYKMGNLFYSLVTIANTRNITLDEAFKIVLVRCQETKAQQKNIKLTNWG